MHVAKAVEQLEPEIVAAISTTTVAERVAATSDKFFRIFVDVWIVFSVFVAVFQYATMPITQFVSYVMLAAGLSSRLSIRYNYQQLARYLFLLPLCFAVVVTPVFVNGVRTPVLAHLPVLVMLTGWMLGRRPMIFVSVSFVLSVSLYWLAEKQGWWSIVIPLRTSDVWAMVWVFDVAFSGFLVWVLIRNYEGIFTQETELQAKIAAALELARSANRELVTVLKNEGAILRLSPMPMALFAPNGQCIETNEAYAEIIGTTRDIVLTINYNESEPWRNSGLLEDCLAVMETNRPRRREAQITTTFGKNIWFDCQMIPIKLNGETHILVQVIDLTERKRLEAELRHLSFHDALTQLPNRRLLLDRLKHAMQLSRRHNSHFALLFLDLNKFKQLNDTYGHEVGDHMLIEVARRLLLVVRDTDTVARLGGDEFVVLLEDLGAEKAKADDHVAAVVEKVLHTLSEEYVLGEIHHQASASIGVKVVCGDGDDPDQIIKDADAAMYRAKQHRQR